MRGIRGVGRGMACLVRGMKGGEGGADEGSVGGKVDCGAGAVEGQEDGLGEGGLRDVVREGKAGGWVGEASSFCWLISSSFCCSICSVCCSLCCCPVSFCLGEPCCCSPGPS